ncbi:MAG: formate/nitrite transporter family protein [Betaproteobacteria bacterium]|nr:formate/nitrite transporter family protein [Betaproteobacteria bacterium]MBI2292107.1 formate/nitrite transporter family protein [Betaproteobacteria bacterium]MBI3056867.1 formate/nitrite transporter family protein [Betaproteobacteria bacterium]
MAEILGFDAFSPKEIADKVHHVGVTKAHLPVLPTMMLGVLAGAFIGLGALFFTLVASDTQLSFGVARVLGGVAFSLGLILVIVGGAELFTGNNLLVMAWADGKITTAEILRNWALVYASNAVGAIGLAVVVYLSRHAGMNEGEVGLAYLKIAAAKTALPFWEAFFKGVLCNLLVCLAVWMALAGRSVTDKVFAIIFPISAFVAAGFEHSVANMYFIPLGIMLKGGTVAPAGVDLASLDWGGFAGNLMPVTLGNIFGGSVMVALVYYLIYRRGLKS